MDLLTMIVIEYSLALIALLWGWGMADLRDTERIIMEMNARNEQLLSEMREKVSKMPNLGTKPIDISLM